MWRSPEKNSYLATAKQNRESTEGYSKTSYLAVAIRVIWWPAERKRDLAVTRTEELSGGR